VLTDGSIVGELGRVKDYKELHPEYQRVEEPSSSCAHMHSRKPPAVNKQRRTWRARVRTVSYRRGVYYYQKRLEAQALLPGRWASRWKNWRCIFISARTTPC
jgi:hypothetical protein